MGRTSYSFTGKSAVEVEVGGVQRLKLLDSLDSPIPDQFDLPAVLLQLKAGSIERHSISIGLSSTES